MHRARNSVLQDGVQELLSGRWKQPLAAFLPTSLGFHPDAVVAVTGLKPEMKSILSVVPANVGVGKRIKARAGITDRIH